MVSPGLQGQGAGLDKECVKMMRWGLAANKEKKKKELLYF